VILDSEFGYELLVCRYAELAWHPEGEPRPAIVSRQLGTRDRRWDTVVIEVDPAAFAARRRFGDRAIDSDLLHVVRDAPADWTWYRDALPDPGYPWRYVRQAVHRAAGRDLVETRRQGNRIELRRIRPYPDWVTRIVAIETNPTSTGRPPTRSPTNSPTTSRSPSPTRCGSRPSRQAVASSPRCSGRWPVEAGILTYAVREVEPGPAVDNERATVDDTATVDADAATVDWLPSDLAPNGPSGRDPGTVTRRLEIAERAYGKGWRSYHDTMRPDCRHFELRRAGRGLVPHCSAKERCPTNRECAGSCPSFAPEPPAWRTKGWPIEGGPGKGIRALLNRRRDRVRDRLEAEDD